MSQNVATYVEEVSDKYKTGRAGEHAYRPTFETLIRSIDKKLAVINDPKRTEYGAPDFIFVRGDIIAGYAETKDIDANLDKVEKTEQLERYLGYSNLILTNYLEFRFFRNGEKYGEPIVIGQIKNDAIHIQEESINILENAITDFFTAKPEAIKSGARLAKIMGGKARRIRDNVKQFLATESGNNQELARIYDTVKKLLVHDLTPETFADMYAQTLVYGLFVARYHDESPANFTRQEARDLVPASNPFLRHFFDHIAGANFDQRLVYIVNELCEVFRLADVQELMRQYYSQDLWGKTHQGPDPVIHFYEDFLKEYDAALRKKMGAFYTPLPVVRFIVKSVDYLLKKEFRLSQGLADTTKIGPIHKVQILDPAVGTGTFISEIVQNIYQSFSGQEGRWPSYVHHDLLPRLHGFELMMAPYTIAHLKLSMKLKETGFHYFNKTRSGIARLGIYLTNSLEGGAIQGEMLSSFGFAQSIADESKEAAKIKNEKPIMVVIGNPPYNVSSSNKNDWILGLMEVYKKDLDEQNIQPLSDDYLKFIRLAEHFVEKNGSGIVAMITNNSFLDGRIHRQMRKHLLETFDDIYILDIHGSSKRKEKALDGGKDENVFDIQQGVSILIFVCKRGKKDVLGIVHHAELYGTRKSKFGVLDESSIQTVVWKKLNYAKPYYFFVPKDFGSEKVYLQGFKIDGLFTVNSVGIVTSKDKFLIDDNKESLEKRYEDILDTNLSNQEFENKYNLKTKYFNPTTARIRSRATSSKIIKCFYRPFDTRFILFDTDFIERDRSAVMQHMILGNNLALICSKQSTRDIIDNIQVADSVIELKFNSHDRNSNLFPLYLFTPDGTRAPNLKKEIVADIEKIVGKTTPEDIFDYIYAVLHSPTYREKYKEFLKIDFPRVPFPKDKKQFMALVELGRKLRELHLLESPKVKEFITSYPEDGSNVVEKVIYKDGKVFINTKQYFGDVPEIAWNFYIGGYQPTQKWLKDRKGRVLTNPDIEHYQKMIVALVETERIMKEIDDIARL